MREEAVSWAEEFLGDVDDIPRQFRVEEPRQGYVPGGPRDLIVWRMAMELTKAVYSSTKSWPADERYSLTSQVRRSVVSVPANIAEGHGRSGDREFLHHLSIASGSLREVETLLEVARDAEYLQDVQFGELMVMCEQTRRPLRGLIAYLRGKQ
ncbi:MAG: four helix bundle protein [Thermomicrobiales bacterium]|nr:four helix bundle protein [Thermomicrobiales bacterium]